MTLYGVEQSPAGPFIVMECVEGELLGNIIPKSGLPLERSLSIARQIADAIGAAHERGIVHRDLKPANIIVGAHDRVKVLDFGLAKLREAAPADTATVSAHELTAEGTILGTVDYMSPEQAEGRTVDERSDVFSFGVVLYELATGERPFQGGSRLSVLSSILRDTPKAVTELNRELPSDLARVVRRCLAKDPDRRYQSAKDLRNDLDDIGESAPGHPGGDGQPIDAKVRRRGTTVSRVAAAVALLAAGALAGSVWRGRPVPPRDAVSVPLTFTRVTMHEGLSLEPSLSPDGKWVVYVSSAAGSQDIYLQSVTGQTAINLTKDSPSADRTPAFSPNGETIVFRSERDGGGLFIMGRTGESVRRLTRTGFQPAWFPDGRQIVFATADAPLVDARNAQVSGLSVVSATGGEPKSLFAGDAVQPRVSPHGLRIAFWAQEADPSRTHFISTNRDVWTIAVDGSHPVRVTTDPANDWNPVWAPDGGSLYFLSNRSGSMNLWRVRIDESTGVVIGRPEPLTVAAPYIRHFALSGDGTLAAYATLTTMVNLARARFDARSATVIGPVEPLTSGPRDFAHMDVSPDGGRIAMTTSPRQQEDVFVIGADGSGLRQLTNDPARDRSVRWAADGRHILFYSDRGGDNVDLWSVDQDGSDLRQLTRSGGRYYPVPSRDGSRVAATDAATWQLYVYDGKDFSKAPEELPPFPHRDPGVGQLTPLEWSLDNRQLLLQVLPGMLWSYSFDTQQYRALIDMSGQFASWLPEGHRVLLSRKGRLAIFDPMSAESHDVLSIPGETITGGRVTRDGSFVYFLHGAQTGDIWLTKFTAADLESPSQQR